ncbi:MAG: YihY/virulence factor BrkB family protein [Nocardioides sp.]|nr:YihY/virulence factor BrkB family protein [Nocardioides sp.]
MSTDASTSPQHVPDPDDPRKPDSPTDLTTPSRKYILRKTLREFSEDECTDLAAALTYWAVLALFPALIALTSLLGLVGQARTSVDTVLDVLDDLLTPSTMETIRPVVEGIAESETAGFTLVAGLLGALFTASGYVGAFGRAMNRVYEIDEGRPLWKLRPMMMLVTLVTVLLVATVLLMLVVSGPVAEAIGNAVGLGSTAVFVWNVAKWPVLLGLVMLVVAILYWATPNVRQPKFRWISAGAFLAIVVWVIASLGFGFYVANFGSYNATYGSLAGVIIFLLWLWITNIALLFGAELDAELERGRQLQAGMAAEISIQLPARDTSGIEKSEAKSADDIRRGREIRESAERNHDFTVAPHEEHVAATGESTDDGEGRA